MPLARTASKQSILSLALILFPARWICKQPPGQSIQQGRGLAAEEHPVLWLPLVKRSCRADVSFFCLLNSLFAVKGPLGHLNNMLPPSPTVNAVVVMVVVAPFPAPAQVLDLGLVPRVGEVIASFKAYDMVVLVYT